MVSKQNIQPTLSNKTNCVWLKLLFIVPAFPIEFRQYVDIRRFLVIFCCNKHGRTLHRAKAYINRYFLHERT